MTQTALDIACKTVGLTKTDLHAHSKRYKQAHQRGLVYLHLAARHNLSTVAIGRMCRRHHTSVISALRTIGDRFYGLPRTASVAEVVSAYLGAMREGRAAA